MRTYISGCGWRPLGNGRNVEVDIEDVDCGIHHKTMATVTSEPEMADFFRSTLITTAGEGAHLAAPI